ncbi:hypothetical protein ANANG_G00052040 [Anguilla anguilla]|uniref:Chemokine interleukin-8-like domain-containing protein n=1 Tax=Anguilla anguilla TaxID=7936 RepID=A0A9D3MZ46_ANGAN|nr:hypothetical protein ANANG_G00052040 [Anguilla anguilla]
MALTLKTLGFFLTVVLCFLLNNAQFGESAYIPPVRCLCPQAEPSVPERLIANFSITEKGAHCQTDTIIVVTPKKVEICLSAEGKQGQDLIECWNRINKDENKKRTCLRRRKPQNK